MHSEASYIKSRGYYIYEAPVRIWHWITAVSIVVLAVTGYFIGTPLPSQPGEATFVYVMGWMRLIHFSAAYVFTIALLFRIYWGMIGNSHSREIFYLPLTRRSWYYDLIGEIRWFTMIDKKCHKFMGHNPVAHVAMFGYFWLSVFMIISGFALYGEGMGTESWVYKSFGWVISLAGGNTLALHYWHRLGMWFVVTFVILHMYAAIREDIMSRQTVISTMVSGWRWFRG